VLGLLKMRCGLGWLIIAAQVRLAPVPGVVTAVALQTTLVVSSASSFMVVMLMLAWYCWL